MSTHDLEILIHALISSKVDHCNVLFRGLPKKTIKQLQLVQNAAAEVLRTDHITPTLPTLQVLTLAFSKSQNLLV